MRLAIATASSAGHGHAAFGHGDLELVHHRAEEVAVLGHVDGLGAGAQDVDAVLLERGGEVERRLAAELRDDAQGLFLFVDGEHVLQRQGLEVELVRGVVVGGDGLRVAVDHDRLKAQGLERLCRVHAAVVELDALADAVGAGAEDHDLLGVCAHRGRVLDVVGGEVVVRVLGAGNVHALPAGVDAVRLPGGADLVLRQVQELGKVAVGEAVLLGGEQRLAVGKRALVREQRVLLVHELLHLLEEVGLDLGQLPELRDACALAQRLIEDKLPLGGGLFQELEQLLQALFVEVLGKAQAVSSVLQGADRLLEGFFIGLADAHDLAHGAHLRAELVLGLLELLKGPSGELDDHVVAAGDVVLERAVLAAGDVGKRQARCQHRRNQRDGEARRLGGQGRGARGARVDLDDDDAPGLRVAGELHVRAADDLDGVHDLVRLALQLLLHVLGDGEHGRRAEGVARVHAQGVDVLDEADGDHVAVLVAHDLQLQLLPAEHALLDQHLADERGLQPARAHRGQLQRVVDDAAARAAHGVGRAQHHRVAETVRDGERLVHGIGDLGSGHVDAQVVHRLLELDAVLAALDGVHLHADDLDVVLVQHAQLVQLRAEVQAALPAEVGQEPVRPLLFDDVGQPLGVERLDVGHVRDARVRHDGGRVGVDQHDLIPQIAQGLAGLGAGVVEFARLADDDGSRSDDENLFRFRHVIFPFFAFDGMQNAYKFSIAHFLQEKERFPAISGEIYIPARLFAAGRSARR